MDYKVLKVIKDKSTLTPAVKLIEYQGRPAIWKDYSSRPQLVRKGWGDILVNNEYTILKRLQGVAGIPKALARTENGFIVEYVPGEFIHKFAPGALPYEIIHKLATLIENMHQHYVVHLDLAQRKNIIIAETCPNDRSPSVGRDFAPYLIDFANALYIRPKNIFARQMFKYLALIDYGSLLKFKNRYFPEQMTDEDKKFMKKFWAIRRLWFLSPKTFRPKDRV